MFYEVFINSNEKMSQDVYVKKILEPMIKPWIERRDEFILEENEDSGHGTRRGKRLAVR